METGPSFPLKQTLTCSQIIEDNSPGQRSIGIGTGWIEGHHDSTKPLRFLDFWALQNIYMDKLAKAFMVQAI
jgi:hypothetical protein